MRYSLLLRNRAALVIFFVLVFSGVSSAQSSSESPVHWSARPPADPIRAGLQFEVVIEAVIDAGWHIFSATQAPPPIATSFRLPPGGPFQIAANLRQPKPKTAFDPNFEIQTEFFTDKAEFWIPLKAPASVRPGDYKVSIQTRCQVCNDRSCLPPQTVPVAVAIMIISGAAPDAGPASVQEIAKPQAATQSEPLRPADSSARRANMPVADPPAGTPAEVQQARSGGFLPFLWLAMTMGALSLATPCVFPMIPITVSYFTKSAETNRASGWRLALVYCFGIIFTFTGLGLGLAALLGATGINQFAANPWINLLITAIFLGFAFNLFGLYQIRIPSSLLTKLSKAGSGSSYASALLMGLTFTLTSFTCTVPFIGTVLVATSQGDWLWPAMGMLGFAVVFAVPFFLLALAPRMLVGLPKSGGWMNSVKVTMGFLEIAAAMKFISNVDLVWQWHVFTREVVLSVWLATSILAAVYLLGKFQLPHDTPLEHLNALRMTAALIFLAFGFYLLTGLMGAGLGEVDAFLPPRTAGAFSPASVGQSLEIPWNTDLKSALAEARRQNKLIFIDFTGYTCTNCRWMEANVFRLPAVSNSLQKYVRLQLYTDGEGKIYEDNQNYQKEKFGTVALPLYAIIDSQENKLATFPGMTRNAAEFERFLNTPFATANQEIRGEEK
jgi:thiol:disulfide interchange protein